MKTQFLVVLLCITSLQAATRSGTSAAVFLKLVADARSRSLAEATAAMPAACASQWAGPGNVLVNPASLAGSLKPAYAFSHEKRMAGIDHGMLQASRPFSERLTLAVAASWIDVPEQEITTLDDPAGTGMSYDYSDLALGFSAGWRLTDRLSTGASLRYVRQDLHNERAEGVGVDLGLLLATGWRNLHLAMVASNFGSRMSLEGEDLLVESPRDTPANLETAEFQLPLSFRVGLYDRIWQSGPQQLDAYLQATHVNDSRETLGAGLEYFHQAGFFLRAGQIFGRDLENWSLGCGFRLRLPGSDTELQLDYAYTDQDYFSGLQQISLSLLP
jgi:hypothetical protein